MFLTDEEIMELTGAKLRSLQIRWLEGNGWEHVVSRMGKPKVLRALAERKLGLTDTKKTCQTEPDFSQWEKAA